MLPRRDIVGPELFDHHNFLGGRAMGPGLASVGQTNAKISFQHSNFVYFLLERALTKCPDRTRERGGSLNHCHCREKSAVSRGAVHSGRAPFFRLAVRPSARLSLPCPAPVPTFECFGPNLNFSTIKWRAINAARRNFCLFSILSRPYHRCFYRQSHILGNSRRDALFSPVLTLSGSDFGSSHRELGVLTYGKMISRLPDNLLNNVSLASPFVLNKPQNCACRFRVCVAIYCRLS